MISLCISVFGFEQLDAAVKTPDVHSFGNKSSNQLLLALENLDPAANHKPQTTNSPNTKKKNHQPRKTIKTRLQS